MTFRETAQNVVQRAVMRVVAGIEKWESGVGFNPLDPRKLDNPYPFYHELREKDPVHRSRVGPWIISRYADAVEVFQDKRMSSDLCNSSLWPTMLKLRLKSGRTQDEIDNPEMLHSDPPRHTRLRGLVNQAFTPAAISAFAPRIEQIVNELLDNAVSDGKIDLVKALAQPLPVIFIAEMLGIAAKDHDKFRHWSREILRGYGYPNLIDYKAGLIAEREFENYLRVIIEKRRRDPQDDVITRLVQAEAEGDRLSMQDLFSICTLLLVGGNETTGSFIGNALLALLRHPDQLQQLRDDPSLFDSAVEELLRYDGPIVVDGRFATEPFEFKGRQIKKGQTLLLLVGAINRDPARFENPDMLDLRRENNRHLAFGRGIHYCLGAALARLETSILLRVLLNRFPNIHLEANGVKRMAGNWGLRGLLNLPVRVN